MIKYMTDGMLLREFLSEPDLKSYRYVRLFWKLLDILTLLHADQPKLHRALAVLSAKGLR